MTDREWYSGASTAAAGFFQRAAEGVAAAGAVVAEKGGALLRRGAAGAAAGSGVAKEALAGYAGNLDWSLIDHSRWLKAGARGASRGVEEARLVWESLPEQLRALGPEAIAKRLDGFDWSHIVPHSRGGGNEAANGIFERASLNRARGAEWMTRTEIEAAAQVLSQTAFKAALREIASRAWKGAALGAAVSCAVACLEHGLEYQRGDIDRDEMYRRIGSAVARSAAGGAAVSGVMTALALAFPVLIPLAAPLLLPLAALGAGVVGLKIARLGKGWYELYRESPAVLPAAPFPAAILPTPEHPPGVRLLSGNGRAFSRVEAAAIAVRP